MQEAHRINIKLTQAPGKTCRKVGNFDVCHILLTCLNVSLCHQKHTQTMFNVL